MYLDKYNLLKCMPFVTLRLGQPRATLIRSHGQEFSRVTHVETTTTSCQKITTIGSNAVHAFYKKCALNIAQKSIARSRIWQ